MSSPEYYDSDHLYFGGDSDDGEYDDDDVTVRAYGPLGMLLGMQAWNRVSNQEDKNKKSLELQVDDPDLTKKYEGADVILSVEGRQLFCNKQLLCMASPVLEEAVVNTAHSSDGITELKLYDKKYEEIHWLLRWITPTIRSPVQEDGLQRIRIKSGKGLSFQDWDSPVAMTAHRATALLPLAMEYQMPALCEDCVDSLMKTLNKDSMNLDRIIKILQLAETYKLKTLFDKAVDVAAKQSHLNVSNQTSYESLEDKTKDLMLSQRIQKIESQMMQGCTYTPKMDLSPEREGASEAGDGDNGQAVRVVDGSGRVLAEMRRTGEENGKPKTKRLLETYIGTMNDLEKKERRIREEYQKTVDILGEIKDAWEGTNASGLCSEHQQLRGKRDYACETCEREFNFTLQRKITALEKYREERKGKLRAQYPGLVSIDYD